MATDTRVRVTKKLIKDSFIELLELHPLNKISVTQICKKAEINRVTFYKYYSDTFDLYEKIVDELIEESSRSMEELCCEKNLREAIEAVLTSISEQSSRYYILFSDHIDAFHHSKSIELCMSKISSFALPNLAVPDEQRPWLQTFLSFGGGGILAIWINEGMEQPPKEIADIIYSYIMQILKLYKK